MEEKTILAMLTKVVARLLDEAAPGLGTESREKLALHVADGAWNGLIVLLRQSLSGGQEVFLEDLGRFAWTEGHISLEPAAALTEAAALATPAEQGHRMIAAQALFLLHEGLRLVERTPPGMKLDPADVRFRGTPEENFLHSLLGMGKITDVEFSGKVATVARRLEVQAARLRHPGPILMPGTEAPARVVSPAAVEPSAVQERQPTPSASPLMKRRPHQ